MTLDHQATSRLKAPQRFHMLSRHRPAQVVNGIIYVSPPTSPYHQRLVYSLTSRLGRHIDSRRLGEVLPVDTGVYLEGKRYMMPDFVFIAKDNYQVKFLSKGILGPPDLIIEVLSPGTRNKDKTTKKVFFEVLGVREYWMVDPETKDSVGYLLEHGRYSDPLQLNSMIDVRILKRSFKF